MTANTKIISLRTILKANRLDYVDEVIDRFIRFEELVKEWNQRLNLVSRKDEDNVLFKHVMESLGVACSFRIPEKSSWVDVGTGGGFPGIPLAIAIPSLRITLVDSIKKKTTAVQDIVERLALPNVRVVCERAEVLAATPQHTRQYDFVIARAVAPLTDLIRWCAPLLDSRHREPLRDLSAGDILPRGTMVLLKGGDVATELERATVKSQPAEQKVFPLIIEGLPDPASVVGKKIVFIQP